jgi:hypothetical protein
MALHLSLTANLLSQKPKSAAMKAMPMPLKNAPTAKLDGK